MVELVWRNWYGGIGMAEWYGGIDMTELVWRNWYGGIGMAELVWRNWYGREEGIEVNMDKGGSKGIGAGGTVKVERKRRQLKGWQVWYRTEASEINYHGRQF